MATDPTDRQLTEWTDDLRIIQQTTAETLIEWQDDAGLTQVEAADRIRAYLQATGGFKRGVTNATLSRYRNPQRIAHIPLSALATAAHVYGHTLTELGVRWGQALAVHYARISGSWQTEREQAVLAAMEREHRMLSGWRLLSPEQQDAIEAAVFAMARTRLQQAAPSTDEIEASRRALFSEMDATEARRIANGGDQS